MYAERLLPHDVDAEESVVGSILIDSLALTGVSSFLTSADFYLAKTRSSFEACLAIFDRGEAINQVTVAHQLSLMGRLEEVGGASYLGHLVSTVPTSVHIEHYARIVQRASTMRQLISAAGNIATIGYEGSADPDSSLDRAEKLLYEIRSGRGTRDFVHIRQVLDTFMEEGPVLDVSADGYAGPVPTGFSDLDELLGNGLQRSDMVVLAARPSLGKSSLAFNIVRNAAGQGFRVGVFSLEMSAEQIGIRLVAGEAGVDSHRMRIDMLNEREMKRKLDAIGVLSDLPLYIDDTPIQGVVEIRGKAIRLKSERGLDLIVVDYLQLIGDMSGRRENRAQEMGEISRSLKGLARDLNVPLVACSQLNRAIENRPSHRPILSDLRESGSIEQDADIVAFIHREDQHTTRDEWEKRHPTDPYPENVAELLIAKHRNGPTGTIPLYFRQDVVRFESLERRALTRELA